MKACENASQVLLVDSFCPVEMRQTNDREQRREQRRILTVLYADYHAPRHDAFVARYQGEISAARLAEYELRRNI